MGTSSTVEWDNESCVHRGIVLRCDEGPWLCTKPLSRLARESLVRCRRTGLVACNLVEQLSRAGVNGILRKVNDDEA